MTVSIRSNHGIAVAATGYLEVEALIRQTVEDILSNISSEKPRYCSVRRTLIDKLISYLESNAEWVETYRATGEILLPGSFDDDGDFHSPIREVRLSISGSVALVHRALPVGLGAMSARDCITMPLERDQDTSRRPKDERWCFPSCLHNVNAN